MKKLAWISGIVLFFGLVAFQCEEEPRECCVPPVCSEKPTISGKWRLESYENQTTGVSEKDPQPEGKGVIYSFADDEKTGTIEGHTFVNTIQGSYTLDKDCNFKVTTFGGTKVGEPGWSNKAWLPSNKTGYYQRYANKLVIYFDGSEERLLFTQI